MNNSGEAVHFTFFVSGINLSRMKSAASMKARISAAVTR